MPNNCRGDKGDKGDKGTRERKAALFLKSPQEFSQNLLLYRLKLLQLRETPQRQQLDQQP